MLAADHAYCHILKVDWHSPFHKWHSETVVFSTISTLLKFEIHLVRKPSFMTINTLANWILMTLSKYSFHSIMHECIFSYLCFISSSFFQIACLLYFYKKETDLIFKLVKYIIWVQNHRGEATACQCDCFVLCYFG